MRRFCSSPSPSITMRCRSRCFGAATCCSDQAASALKPISAADHTWTGFSPRRECFHPKEFVGVDIMETATTAGSGMLKVLFIFQFALNGEVSAVREINFADAVNCRILDFALPANQPAGIKSEEPSPQRINQSLLLGGCSQALAVCCGSACSNWSSITTISSSGPRDSTSLRPLALSGFTAHTRAVTCASAACALAGKPLQ
ncbi:Uncharacterised protein [Escherichia coli]|uniref:Uncharacterized protein n=1 Tax=Escherichia coli TaxID=562 RepID=A0A376MQJ8_ECOLX|nr:Uncharacterised protein [Escherichia coli]